MRKLILCASFVIMNIASGQCDQLELEKKIGRVDISTVLTKNLMSDSTLFHQVLASDISSDIISQANDAPNPFMLVLTSEYTQLPTTNRNHLITILDAFLKADSSNFIYVSGSIDHSKEVFAYNLMARELSKILVGLCLHYQNRVLNNFGFINIDPRKYLQNNRTMTIEKGISIFCLLGRAE